MWHNWTNALLGLWIILSSFLGMSQTATIVNYVVIGFLVGATGFYRAYRDYDEMPVQQSREHEVQVHA